MNTPPPSAPSAPRPAPIDPADLALPPTEPIDITAIMAARLTR